MILFAQKAKNSERLPVFLISLFLVLGTAAVYWQVHGFDFVNYDDMDYISQNPHIQKGLSFGSIIWAFTTGYFCNWHPVTWLSYLLDFQIFRLWAGGYHLVNLFFHILNALLLFSVFRKMTGRTWQSGFVAALFALHPLHVESVAWISERKDVLSAFFWILTIHAYVHYARRPLWSNYVWVMGFFILGLMSKPMVVTLPFVLLLLDFWPMGRMNLDAPESELKLKVTRLIQEKIPLFLLAAASAVITFLAQKQGGAVQSFDRLPLAERLANILITYIRYITNAIYPVNLSAFYPYPDTISWWKVVSAGVMLAILTGLAIWRMRQNPYLIVGWLWFIGTLVPVIGLIQVGGQSMADRYMYLPIIGLFIIAAWGLPDLLALSRHQRTILGMLAMTVISIASFITWTQIGCWRDSVTLFSHAIAILPDNTLAQYNLGEALSRARYNVGEALSRKGALKQALVHYEVVLKRNPMYHDALINMGLTLLNMEKPSEALIYINRVLKIKPDDAQALRMKGYAMAAQGNYEKAIPYYEQAVKTDPLNGELHFLMGVAYSALQKPAVAIVHYQKAIEITPDDTTASINLGNIYYRSGRMDLAGNVYLYALQHAPDNPDVLSKLGAVALGLGQTDRALAYFNQALKIKPDNPESQKGLAAILRIKQNKKK